MLDTGVPRPLGDEKEHYWLVQRMAQANGTDLVTASDEGLLLQEEWAAMVQRCRGCAWAEGCQRWLDKPVEAVRTTPRDCVNHRHFAALQRKLRRSQP